MTDDRVTEEFERLKTRVKILKDMLMEADLYSMQRRDLNFLLNELEDLATEVSDVIDRLDYEELNDVDCETQDVCQDDL